LADGVAKHRDHTRTWSDDLVRLEPSGPRLRIETMMVKFLLWCILLFLCWPLALVALVIFPLVWLILVPFRLAGIAVEGVLQLVWAIVTLPARILRGFA